MSIILALLALLLVPVLALKGKAYRGVYGAVAVLGGVVGYIAVHLPGPIRPSMTDAETVGQVWINEYADDVAAVSFGLGLGALVGALLYRVPGTPASSPLVPCPHCAEPVQLAATFCKHCRRDIPPRPTDPSPAPNV